ncbi:MAG: Rrf2 family transcriptional regulator [Brumimicrobium sp.]
MLSKKTKYAIHALSFLAKKDNKTPQLIVNISEETKTPRKFLESILLDLKKNGYLGSKMGKGGGYYLLKEAKDIKLSNILRLFDGPIAYLPCASLNYYESCEECVDETQCGLHHIMVDVRDETLKLLENKSIQDILDKEN